MSKSKLKLLLFRLIDGLSKKDLLRVHDFLISIDEENNQYELEYRKSMIKENILESEEYLEQIETKIENLYNDIDSMSRGGRYGQIHADFLSGELDSIRTDRDRAELYLKALHKELSDLENI